MIQLQRYKGQSEIENLMMNAIQLWALGHIDSEVPPNIDDYIGPKPDCNIIFHFDYEMGEWDAIFVKPL